MKILLVEDHQHTRLLLQDVLRTSGVREIYHSEEGGQALELLRKKEVDVVFTDLAMQPMNGIEFTRRLRNDADSPNRFLPVIMVTGHATKARIAAARDAGVNEFLVKPITGRGVLDRMRQVINGDRNFVRSGDYFGPDRRRRDTPNYAGPLRRSGDRKVT